MQQAARVSQRTAYFHLGKLIEVGKTERIFTNPSHKLTEAAGILSREKDAVTLRYLQTMADMSHEKNQTIFFPFPMEMLRKAGTHDAEKES